MRLLTKSDVERVAFDQHWFAGGYDRSQVDDFLDEVARTFGVNAAIITSQAHKLENYRYRIEALEAKEREEASK